MKTTYILHGGFTPGGTKNEDDAFFGEILSRAPQDARVLLVYFAKEPDRIAKNQAEDIEQFERNKGNKTLMFETATEAEFPEQVRSADIVYLHGGFSAKLLEELKRYPNLKELFEGKVVAGDSAGANVLASVFYSHRANEVMRGFGLVPVKLICHYTEDYTDKLAGIEPGLETLFLSEYQTNVF